MLNYKMISMVKTILRKKMTETVMIQIARIRKAQVKLKLGKKKT